MEELTNWEKILFSIKTFPFNTGWILLSIAFLIWVIKILSDTITRLQIIKSNIFIPLAKIFKFKRLVKEAIKNDIKGNVNSFVKEFETELPKGWIKEMEIKWVKEETQESFIEDNNIVIRMLPMNNQDLNFVNATYLFIKESLFPKTKRVIPFVHRETAILSLCHRIIRTKRKEYLDCFEENILENSMQKNKTILNYLERYNYIDNFGFFTSAFIREIDKIAKEVRFKKEQNKIEQEINLVLKHIEKFIRDKGDIPDNEWHREGLVAKYSFLLIAKPGMVYTGVKPYIKRAKKAFNSGVSRLYIFGTSSEKEFARKVINSISKSIPECILEETFKLSNDYRNKKGGIGALFTTAIRTKALEHNINLDIKKT